MPRITTASVFVDDQAKALAFYTDVLGFQPKTDVPVGGAAPCPSRTWSGPPSARWRTTPGSTS